MISSDHLAVQELEETLKQERNNEQLLRMEKDLEPRESLLSLGTQNISGWCGQIDV